MTSNEVHSDELVLILSLFFEPSTSTRGTVVIIVMIILYGLFGYSYGYLTSILNFICICHSSNILRFSNY